MRSMILVVGLLLASLGFAPSSAQDIGDIIDIIGEETAQLFEAEGEVTTERWDWVTLHDSQTQISVDRVKISEEVDRVCVYVRREGGPVDDMQCESVGRTFELAQISAINAPPLPDNSGVARDGYRAYFVTIVFDVLSADITGLTFIVQAPLDTESPTLVG